MRLLGVHALFQRPIRLSRTRRTGFYPYLLRDLRITRPPRDARMLPTFPCSGACMVAVMDWASLKVLSFVCPNARCEFLRRGGLARGGHAPPEIFNSDQGTNSPASTSPIQGGGHSHLDDGKGRWMARVHRAASIAQVRFLSEFATGSQAQPASAGGWHFYDHRRPVTPSSTTGRRTRRKRIG